MQGHSQKEFAINSEMYLLSLVFWFLKMSEQVTILKQYTDKTRLMMSGHMHSRSRDRGRGEFGERCSCLFVVPDESAVKVSKSQKIHISGRWT